jgi:hypothetical protein
MTTTLIRYPSLTRRVAVTGPLLQRLTAWMGQGAELASEYHTRDSAASLYARAARYESTQPGFAADLRAAAEAMDRAAAKAAR